MPFANLASMVKGWRAAHRDGKTESVAAIFYSQRKIGGGINVKGVL